MSISELWKLPGKTGIEKYAKMYKTKHGMFAGVPIICRDTKCPYKDICIVDEDSRVVGTRCQMEAAAILARFDLWCEHFGIDISSEEIKKEDLVDASLIRDLVENEIQTLRAENRIALNSDIIGKTIVEVDRQCNVYEEDTIIPEANYKLQLQDKRYKILNLLNSTRKDKSNQLKNQDPSSKAIGILNKVDQLLKKNEDSELKEIHDDSVKGSGNNE